MVTVMCAGAAVGLAPKKKSTHTYTHTHTHAAGGSTDTFLACALVPHGTNGKKKKLPTHYEWGLYKHTNTSRRLS